MNDDVWHTPPETPDIFKPHPIIVIYEAGDQIEQMDSTEYNVISERYVNRWCYVDDLIKENENICEALEQSETCCSEWEKQALDYKAENIALSGELERTRKALDVAKERLKNIILDVEVLATPEYLASRAKETLAEIAALEQKE